MDRLRREYDDKEDAEAVREAWVHIDKVLADDERLFLHLDDPEYLAIEAALSQPIDAEGKWLKDPAVIAYSEMVWGDILRAEADAKLRASFKNTLPLVPGGAPTIPALLTRSDGRTPLVRGSAEFAFRGAGPGQVLGSTNGGHRGGEERGAGNLVGLRGPTVNPSSAA